MQEGMADLESLLEYSQIVSRLFASEDEGFQFYNAYGLKKGFSVRGDMLSGTQATMR